MVIGCESQANMKTFMMKKRAPLCEDKVKKILLTNDSNLVLQDGHFDLWSVEVACSEVHRRVLNLD